MLAVLAVVAVPTAFAQAQIAPAPQPVATATPVPVPSPAEQARAKRDLKKQLHKLRAQIKQNRNSAWRWQDIMQVSKAYKPYPRANTKSVDVLKHLVRIWRKRKIHAKQRASAVPHKWAWLCIHRYEGSWTAATGNGYYGGLQMDYAFMRKYGGHLLSSKGPANNWTPLEQMWVAEIAAFRRGRGFYPWPNTARKCGLI
jgi:hypothetical protein